MKATKAGPRKRAQIRDEVMVYYKDLYIIDDYDEEQSSDQQEEEACRVQNGPFPTQ